MLGSMRSLQIAAIFSLLLILWSCDSSGENSQEIAPGTMVAQINGKDWQATATAGAVRYDQVPEFQGIGILGASGTPESFEDVIILGIFNPDPPGEFTVTSGTYVVGQDGATAGYCKSEGSDDLCEDVEPEDVNTEVVSGEVVVESIDEESVQGRFRFEMGEISVTEGRFNLTFSRSLR